MALLALFLPVVLLGALLGLERVEAWTSTARPSQPEGLGRAGLGADAEPAPRPATSRPAPEAAAAHAV